MPASCGKACGSSSVKTCVEPESNHTSRMSVTFSHSAGLGTRSSEEALPARPSSNQASAPFWVMAARMRAISSSDLANLADGITSPVSLCWKTVMGTPQARWREITQSGRASIMPRRRFWPEAGTNSVSAMACSAVFAQGAVAAHTARGFPLPLVGRG